MMTTTPNPNSVYRLVLVGNGGVGKSGLTIQYTSSTFVEEYDPTLEECYRKHTNVGDEELVLDIFDTAGQEDFSAVRDQYMRTGDGFLCVYAINLRSTFDEIESFHEQILRVKDTELFPFVLIGNKCDMEHDRKVTTEEGQQLAQKLGCTFMETSAKTNHNVEQAFNTIVLEIKKYRQKHQADEPSYRPRRKFCSLF